MNTTKEQGAAHGEIVARHRGLVGRTVLVSILTLVSRILGYVRDLVSAMLFGSGSAVFDAFLTAWRVPNLFRRLFGEGALSTSLQTAITEADGDEGNEAGRRLFVRTLLVTTQILVVVAAGSMVAAYHLPDAMPGTGWRWLGADPEPVRDLTVRLMPFVLVVCLAALCAGALQVRGRFGAPNLAPIAMNLVWLASLVGLGFAFGWSEAGEPADLDTQWRMARWLAWGVLLGGVAQLVVQVPSLARNGLLWAATPTGGSRGGAARSAWVVLRTSLPLAFGAAVYQINVMVDGLMAEGLLSDGGPTAHYLANRIQQFPLALIAIAATNAVFPSLKALGHTGRLGELRRLHDRAQLGIVFVAVPAAVGLFVLAGPIAAVLFERGNYGPEGVARIAAALRMLALALLPAGAAGLAGRTYYACGDLRRPVQISVAVLGLNVVLNVVLVAGLGMDVEGLTLATAITSWINLGWLLAGLRGRLGLPAGDQTRAALVRRIARVALVAAVSGGCALFGHWITATLLGLDAGASPRSTLALAVAAGAGVLSYLGLARLLRVPEWAELRSRKSRS